MSKRIGSYYWVYAGAKDAPKTWQPARFTGVSGDGDGRETWDFVGYRSEDGHHFVEVKDVGYEVAL